MKNYGPKTNNSDNYDEKYMKIKFNLNDNLPLNKMLELCNTMVVIRSFHEGNKYYQQLFLNKCLYKL